MAVLPNFSSKLFRGTLDRRLEFLAQRGEKPSDQMLRDAAENPLADAGDQTADFADALKRQARCVGPSGAISNRALPLP